MKELLKKPLQTLLSRSGYRIADERNIHDDRGFVKRVRSAGFVPRTVIDVGVAKGTPYLYAGFPRARFHLFDPTKESLPYMQAWKNHINAEIYNFGLGSQKGKLTIRVRDTIQHSTFLLDLSQPALQSTYDVDVRRFDELDVSIDSPTLAKIDVEGFELEVLRGMAGRIQEIDVFIIETSLATLYDGGANAFEVVQFMKEAGFRVIDIAGIKRRPFDSLIHQIDYVFARYGTQLARSIHQVSVHQ